MHARDFLTAERLTSEQLAAESASVRIAEAAYRQDDQAMRAAAIELADASAVPTAPKEPTLWSRVVLTAAAGAITALPYLLDGTSTGAAGSVFLATVLGFAALDATLLGDAQSVSATDEARPISLAVLAVLSATLLGGGLGAKSAALGFSFVFGLFTAVAVGAMVAAMLARYRRLRHGHLARERGLQRLARAQQLLAGLEAQRDHTRDRLPVTLQSAGGVASSRLGAAAQRQEAFGHQHSPAPSRRSGEPDATELPFSGSSALELLRQDKSIASREVL